MLFRSFYVSISGKEYTNSKNGKVGVELQFSRYKTFGSVSDVEEKGAEKVLGKIYIKKLTPTTEQPKEEALF